jgi:hypothetical protein
MDKLFFTILGAVSEPERDRIRERIRDVNRNRATRAFLSDRALRLAAGGQRRLGARAGGAGSRSRQPARDRGGGHRGGLPDHAHERAVIVEQVARPRVMIMSGESARTWLSQTPIGQQIHFYRFTPPPPGNLS